METTKNRFCGLTFLCVIAFHFLLLSSQSNLAAQEIGRETISARVLEVARDGSSVTINRGRADNIVPGSLCTIRPNRGEDYAAIEWDLYFAIGTVSEIRETEAVVILTDLKESVIEGDYCDVEANIPANLANTDLGRIAIYDIRLLYYEKDVPFFELRDLILDSSQGKLDSIVEKLVEEIHKHVDVVESWAYGDRIKGGFFDGLSWGEAFRKTDRQHVETYLEFVGWYPGKFINFDWPFIEIYATWMANGTLSGEPEKRKAAAKPFADEGDDLVDAGRYQEAIDAYKSALDILPDYVYAKNRLSLVNSMLKHIKMVEGDPQDVLARFQLGKLYYDLYRYEQALEQFLRARELGFDRTSIDKWIGYSYSGLERYVESREIFEALKEQLPKDDNILKWLVYVTAREEQANEGATAESYIKTGDIKYREESYDSAITEYKNALELKPESTLIWERILKTTKRRDAAQRQRWALDYWSNGQFENAKNQWETAIEVCKDIEDLRSEVDIIDEMADAMYDSAFYGEAIKVYKRILERDPANYDSHISISNCYKEMKDYPTSVRWAKRGINVNPDEAWGYNVLGYILLKMGDMDQAIVNLLRATELDNEYKYPNLNLGTAYVLKGEYTDAQRYLRRAIEIDKDYWDARNDLVAIEVALETEQILAQNPDDLDSRLRFARALYDLEDYRRSIAELQRVTASKRDATAFAYLGYAHSRLGEYEKARRYLKEAYRLHAKPGWNSWLLYIEAQIALQKDPGDPEAYLKLGEDDLYWEDYDDALASFGRAQQQGADPDFVFSKMELARRGKEAKGNYDISTEYYNRGEYQKSLEYTERALKIYREIGAKRGELWALLRSGWCYASLFRHREALQMYEETGRRAKSLGDETMEANYLSGVGDYYRSVGDFENALKFKEAAGELYNRNNSLIDEARLVLAIVGNIKGAMGEFDNMIAYYQRALSINQNTMNYKGEAEVLNDLGSAYEDDGDYSKALEHTQMALRTAQKYNEQWTEMWAYHSLGSIYLELGDADNTLKYYKSYLDTATALGSKSDRCIALNDMGLVYLELTKDTEKALSLFQNALTLARLIGYRLMEGVATANLGVTASREGRYEEALRFHREGLAIVREINSQYTEMQGLNEMGETYRELKQWDEALKAHLDAIDIADSIGVPTERWQYELNAAKDFEGKENFQRAVDYYKRAAETVAGIKNKIKSEKLREGFSDQDRQIEVYKRLIALLLKMGKAEEALRYIEESKSKIVRDSFGDIKPTTMDHELKETLETVDKIEKKKEAIAKQIQEERQKPQGRQDKTKLAILSNTLATTEGEFNQWMLKLKFQNRKMYDALTIKPTTLGDIQNEIPEGTLILEYFVSSDQLYVFCIGRNYFFAKSVNIEEDELTKLVNGYSRLVQDPYSPRKKILEQNAVRLYDILVRPVETIMDRYENIVVVPFGTLYYVPFHALIREEGGKQEFLIERKRISYTTSATFADLLKDQKMKLDNLMAFGNPDGTLPGASEEVRKIKDDIFKKNARVLTLGDATKENFFEHAKDYDIVHLATHGLIQKNPLESYLLFSGDSEDEKRLTLLEVAGYTALRDRTGLVFLSACQTAMESAGGSGSEMISLAEAFAMAGPPTLIATLWEVGDISTSQLVSQFYSELRDAKKDKLEALRSAQLALLRSGQYSEPFFWAPFVMIGNWR